MDTNAINAPPLSSLQQPTSSQPEQPSVAIVAIPGSSHDSHIKDNVNSSASLSTSYSNVEPPLGAHPANSIQGAVRNVKLQEQQNSSYQAQTRWQIGATSSSISQPSTHCGGSLLPPPQLQLPQTHDRSDTTPFRRSLDGQRTTKPTMLNSDKPLPPQPKGQVPPTINVTPDYTRPISTSAPASASVPTSTPHVNVTQEHLYLSESSSLASNPNQHRISTLSTTSSHHASDDADLSRISLEQPPPYSFATGNQGSSTLIATVAPPTEEHLFQVQELTPPRPIVGSTQPQAQYQYICANPMHDQQYLLVGSGNALHSIDLTLPSEKQTVRTHIQGLAFKEIHCLEDIGLVVVIAGRNSRVRCYDYDSIMRLVSYGHSKEGQGRIVEGGILGAMKSMIQLRVETAISKDDSLGSDSPNTSPAGSSTTSRVIKDPSPSTSPHSHVQPQLPNRHKHTSSIDRTSLLSPPLRSDNPRTGFDFKGNEDIDHHSDSSATVVKHKQRPLSFAGLASLAQEHILRNKGQQQSSQQGDQETGSHTSKGTPVVSSSTPTSPNSGNNSGRGVTKNKRFSQMASYLSQAAVNSNMAAHMTNGQDAPCEDAVDWAWDFTKMKQTKDVLGLDFHYSLSTVYMTVLSKTGIDIYSRSKAARGRKPVQASLTAAQSGNNNTNSTTSNYGYGYGPNSDDSRRISTSTMGGMASASRDSFSSSRDNPTFYEWKLHKQFYHPEAPSFMTVVKDLQDVTDIVLGKGPRACVINVDTMSVNDLHRQTNSSVLQGIGKKLGFKNSPLWHSFEKIPFDVPPYILYPEAAAAISAAQGDTKERYQAFSSGQISGYGDTSSDPGGRSRDDIIQRPSDQLSIHQQQLEEQERAEAEVIALKSQQTQLARVHNALASLAQFSSNSNSSSSSSLSSSLTHQPVGSIPSTTQANNTGSSGSSNSGSGTKVNKKGRMVTSDEVLNKAFCQRTTTQLFLATYGSQSRIVDLQGKPQSPIVLDWGSSPPQKVEFLKTDQDIYALGFEKSSIVVFSLTRAKKVKEISKKDLIQAADAAASVAANGDATSIRGNRASMYENHSSATTAGVSSSASSSIKFLGRDNIADDSLGIFFSYYHPRNGTSICKLGTVPLTRDELELVGYYP
ncbi:hypothetical protein BGX27_011338 [Mortierella sp. AM989]|nr:hypothetical protein BGX27_011338 [Mortierella sp. AM989]